jgi:ankyrin repeat protein
MTSTVLSDAGRQQRRVRLRWRFIAATVVLVALAQTGFVLWLRHSRAARGPLKTGLIQAIQNHDARAANTFLELGADPNAGDAFGRSAVMWAARENDVSLLRTLLARRGGRAGDHDIDGRTPLIWAAMFDAHDAARLLLDRGADPNDTDNDGATALMTAAVNDSRRVADLLLERGADVRRARKEGQTALHVAAMSGRLDIVRGLLARGADVNAANHDNKTARQLADEKGHPDVVALLDSVAGIAATNRPR